jgi:hypothetical protein
MDPHWRGWTVQKDVLRAPNGEYFTPGDILSLRWRLAQIAEYQLQQRLAECIEEQPLPAASTG